MGVTRSNYINMNPNTQQDLLSEFDRIKDKDERFRKARAEQIYLFCRAQKTTNEIEQILWTAKPKLLPLLILFLPIGIVYIAVAIFQICYGFKFRADIPTVILDILFIVTPIALFFMIYALYSNHLYAYSDKRIIIRKRLIKTYLKSINYEEIIESDVKVSLIEKIFKVGTIRFFTGETREDRGKTEKVYYYWRSIENPHEIFNKVKTFINKNPKPEIKYARRNNLE